jgi:hypothetical protein
MEHTNVEQSRLEQTTPAGLNVEKVLWGLLSEQDKTNDKIQAIYEAFEKIEKVLECARNQYGQIEGIRMVK